jgi:hypothetical protein
LGPVVLLTLVGAGAACGPPASAPARPLPPYVGHAKELFDDAIEAKAVGLDLEATVIPRNDARLRERAEVGDAVLRVRVTTVSSKVEDEGSRYLVGFATVDKLGGFFPPAPEFTLVVDRVAPALGIVRTLGGRLVDRPFVAFIRQFVRPDGDVETHFHLAPDTPDEVAAVRDATVGAAEQKRH